MSNLSSDLNAYLAKSGSSVSGQGSSSQNNGFLNGWFGGSGDDVAGSSVHNQSSWFKYSPLNNGQANQDDVELLIGPSTSSGAGAGGGGGSSWLRNPFGAKEPQPPGWLPTLSRTQRFTGFIMFIFMGLTCFGLSTVYIPVLIFKARKFAILFTFGSAFIVLSFAILLGPVNHLKHQFSKERLPFTSAYFASLFATLYFALEVQSTLLTTLFAIIQIIALVWYVVTYIPGGQTGLMFFSRFAASTVSKTLPV